VISVTATYDGQQYFSTRRESIERRGGLGAMYTVFKQAANGKFVEVASRDDVEDAVQLAEALSGHWPGEYVVRDSKGNQLALVA
jgi:hypothetical protein